MEQVTVYDGPDEPSIKFTLDFAGKKIEILDYGKRNTLFTKIDGKEHVFYLVQQSDPETLLFTNKDKNMSFYFEKVKTLKWSNQYKHLRGNFALSKNGKYADEIIIKGTFHGSMMTDK